MSLIITSSNQAEQDTKSVGTGLENPASYQNFFKSPVKVEADSEVALISIKCSRDQDKISVPPDAGFFLYWGQAEPNNEDQQTPDDTSIPVRVVVKSGDYTQDALATEIKRALDDVVKKAFAEVKTITVTPSQDSTTFEFEGFKIKFEQYGDGSGFTDKPSASEFEEYIGVVTEKSLLDDDTFEDEDVTDNFTASASGTQTKIVGYSSTSTGEVCDVIGKAHPLSQVNSQCVIYFNGSVSASNADGYTLGLVRSQGISDAKGKERDFGYPGAYHDEEPDVGAINLPEPYDGTDIPFFWDVCFNWKNGEDGEVLHFIADVDGGDRVGAMKPITLLETPTNASLEAKYWDRVIFEVSGEKTTVKLGQTGKPTTNTLVSNASTTFGDRVKPLGITCNQLYPKISIHNNASVDAGEAWLDTYNGHADVKYYERNFLGYSEGGFGESLENIDLSDIYFDGTVSGGTYTYKGELTSNSGIENKWTLLFTNLSDYFPMASAPRQIKNVDAMGRFLGYPEEAKEADFGTVTGNGAIVEFAPTIAPNLQPKTSMFVRLKNQALNSYNGNKSSVSNIIYACPRFDSQGNSDGLMFYEPSERVYVKFNNVAPFVLNSLELDIVDVNERVIEDLMGNTLITLHIRKSK